MEPSRERDGVFHDYAADNGADWGFNGAVARTRRSVLDQLAAVVAGSSFNGAVARTRRSAPAGQGAAVQAPAASMEPSRERDGVQLSEAKAALGRMTASMEPSRERDGVIVEEERRELDPLLQWSRRANATECSSLVMSTSTVWRLQWSRRANATECDRGIVGMCSSLIGFNGAVARTRRSEEARGAALAQWGASMEPSRERDGVSRRATATAACSARFNGAVARTRRSGRSEQRRRAHRVASMEPSRERDGVVVAAGGRRLARDASMEPSRERDGV